MFGRFIKALRGWSLRLDLKLAGTALTNADALRHFVPYQSLVFKKIAEDRAVFLDQDRNLTCQLTAEDLQICMTTLKENRNFLMKALTSYWSARAEVSHALPLMPTSGLTSAVSRSDKTTSVPVYDLARAYGRVLTEFENAETAHRLKAEYKIRAELLANTGWNPKMMKLLMKRHNLCEPPAVRAKKPRGSARPS